MHERDPGLLRRFSVLTIEAPTVDQAIEILRGIAIEVRERTTTCRSASGAIVAAVRLAKRYLQDRALPDAAIDLLDETAARKRVEIDGVPAKVDDAIRRLSSLKAQRRVARRRRRRDERQDAREARARRSRELEPAVSEMRAKLDSRRGATAALAALQAEEATPRGRARAGAREARTSRGWASSSTCSSPT